ncbi:MAG: thiamine-phosphate kinase, partial [Chthoniobacterales bacterium]|nr:thiamine-phosphate kinase [Chthoniobacterales bacterium]
MADLGENQILEWLEKKFKPSRDVKMGIGEDCAVVRIGREEVTLKTDSMVEGRHFLREHPSRWVGWKAMARPLSDFAAVGAEPKWAMIAISLPRNLTRSYFLGLYGGVKRCAEEYGVEIVGGETSECPDRIVMSVVVVGQGGNCRRKSSRENDAIVVTGELGGSYKTGKHLRFRPRIREAKWLTRNYEITSMMDISDGLAIDLPRLVVREDFGFCVSLERIPVRKGF